MTYTPAKGDRIIVRRTPSIHGGTGVMTGTVLEVLTIGGIEGILDFRSDHYGRAYLATNEQMAEMGIAQTIQLEPRTEGDQP
ncbi:hypothetical protein [Streptomyces sp. NBC_01373]|uniref:hypothetical protein n=1 Tax=Streptomyces sp. NBC_01373 TaxID=2903843 RepID=UPI00224D5517|nr:hypothetical protein [Streptomyces sp. NBC_01373]MCX4707076.1 hypothetical protein [Streptomyces sp. NBC_01373]